MRVLMICFGLLLSCSGFAQTYEEFLKKSYDFLDKNDLVSAEESLKSALRKEPANPLNYALLTNLGTIQCRQGKLDEALISYTSALSGHTNEPTILISRASLYMEMGDNEKALADYNVLLVADPKNEDALYHRGLIYVGQKHFLNAEQDFDQILKLNDKSVNARLGHAILEKERGNFNESEKILDYLIGEKPKNWALYEARAELYFLMGKNGRAMADIEKVFIESEPTAPLYVLRGKIKLAQYEKERAAIDFKKAESMGYNQGTIKELIKLTK